MQPLLKVIEQPQKHYRFRYNSENKYPVIYGESSSKNGIAYPTVELLNYKGLARIKCDLYQVDREERHFYEYKKKGQENDTSTIVPHQGSYIYSYLEMAIAMKTKKEILGMLAENYKRDYPNYDKQKIKQLCQNNIKNVEWNKFRLRFSAHDIHTDKEFCMTYSEPIQNMKSSTTNKLVITHCSQVYILAKGGMEVILFTEKISKNKTEVHIIEKNKDGREILVGKGDITCVHHSYALIFRAPAYINPDITEPVKVFIKLVRTSDGSSSNQIELTYKPSQKNYTKRKISSFSKFCDSKQSNGLTMPNITKTALLRQTRLPSRKKQVDTYLLTEPVDVLQNSNQISNRMANPIQLNQLGISDTAFTHPKIEHNDCNPSDVVGELDTVQFLQNNGFFMKENNDAMNYNGVGNTDSEMEPLDSLTLDLANTSCYDQGLNNIWSTENYGVPSTFDPMLGQTTEIAPPIGASNEEFLEFSNKIDFDIEDLFKLKPDGGGAKEDDPLKLSTPLDPIKSEPIAFFNPQDICKVKKLIKEIYQKLRNGRKYELAQTVEELCEIRLTDGGTFLHMMANINQEKLEVMVNFISTIKMLHVLNLANDFGQTILHTAVMNNDSRSVSFLVAKGCDPMLEDYEGNNAIHYTVKYEGHCLEGVLSAIKKNNIPHDLNAQNFKKQTALHLAAMYDLGRSVEMLLAAGAELRPDAVGRRPLLIAASDSRLWALSKLITTGNIDETDDNGRTALQIVCGGKGNYSDKSRELIKLLLKHEADPFHPSKTGPQMWNVLKNALLDVNISNSVTSESEDEFFSADEDLNEAEEIDSELQKLTLTEDGAIRELK